MRNFIDIIVEGEELTPALQRAKEQGFTTPAYHGTAADFEAFDMNKGRAGHTGYAPFFASIKGEARGYAKKTKGGKVLDCLLRIKKPLILPEENGYGNLPLDVFLLISDGRKPNNLDHMNFRDATQLLGHENYNQTGEFNHREIFNGVYARLRAAGYDAIIYKDTWADHQSKNYDKIQMLDMSGIRLVSAEFDPAKQNVAGLKN